MCGLPVAGFPTIVPRRLACHYEALKFSFFPMCEACGEDTLQHNGTGFVVFLIVLPLSLAPFPREVTRDGSVKDSGAVTSESFPRPTRSRCRPLNS